MIPSSKQWDKASRFRPAALHLCVCVRASHLLAFYLVTVGHIPFLHYIPIILISYFSSQFSSHPNPPHYIFASQSSKGTHQVWIFEVLHLCFTLFLYLTAAFFDYLSGPFNKIWSCRGLLRIFGDLFYDGVGIIIGGGGVFCVRILDCEMGAEECEFLVLWEEVGREKVWIATRWSGMAIYWQHVVLPQSFQMQQTWIFHLQLYW